MVLLLAASHAHRLCQPALPICRDWAGADMIQPLGTEHPGHVLSLCHKLLQTLFTSTRQSRAQPCTSGAHAWGNAPFPSLYPKSEGVGSAHWRYQGPQQKLPVSSILHESPDSLAR